MEYISNIEGRVEGWGARGGEGRVGEEGCARHTTPPDPLYSLYIPYIFPKYVPYIFPYVCLIYSVNRRNTWFKFSWRLYYFLSVFLNVSGFNVFIVFRGFTCFVLVLKENNMVTT